MQKEQFFQLLHTELIRCGLPREDADRQIRNMIRALAKEDLPEIERIENPDEITELAHGIVMLRQRKKPRPDLYAQPQSSSPGEEPASATETDTITDATDDDMKIYRKDDFVKSPPSPSEFSDPEDYEEYIKDDDDTENPPPTVRGKRIFWTLFVCTLPLSVSLLAVYLGVFGAVFLTLCALIVLLVGAMIGGVAAGAAISLIGIIYGITQLITVSSTAPGLYEIGLGLAVAGAVMIGGILLYNTAIRLIPFLIRYLSVLFQFCTAWLKQQFQKVKEVCYRL